MKIKFKKMRENAQVPFRGSYGAAGYDLTACEIEKKLLGFIPQIVCKTGIAVEIPKGYVGLIFPRSSSANTYMRMANCVGVIDSDYRGEISAVFDQIGHGPCMSYEEGDRCCQLVIVPCIEAEFEEVESLCETERGSNGYGSTGA